MPLVTSRQLRTLIRFEREVKAAGVKSRGKSTWVKVAEVRADVEDRRLARSETTEDGITIGGRRCRIRCRYRADVDSSMRVRVGPVILQIISGPARADRDRNMEIEAAEYTTAGNAG